MEADSLYLDSAAQDYAPAQYKHGYCWEKDIYKTGNTEFTKKQALEWYQKAADQGNEDAQKAINRLTNDGLGTALVAGAVAAGAGLLWKWLTK